MLTSSKFIRSLFQAVTKFAVTAVISLLTTVFLRKAIRWSKAFHEKVRQIQIETCFAL